MLTIPTLRRLTATCLIGVATAGCGATSTSSGSAASSSAAPGAASSSSGAGSSSNTTAPSDPCSLITTDQAAAALGVPVKAGRANTTGAGEECVFDATSVDLRASVVVLITAKPFFDGFKTSAGSQPVSDIGDEAFLSRPPTPFLYVHKGGTYFGVQVFHVTTADTGAEKTLAKQIAAKI